MREIKFQQAFQVAVYHPYFREGICNCLSFQPAAETVKLLKRFDCAADSNDNVFRFYLNTAGSISSYLEHIKKTSGISSFTFEVKTTDPRFVYFTGLPAEWAGQLLYDTQSGANNFDDNVLHLAEKLAQKKDSNAIGLLTVHFDDIIKYSSEKGYAKFDIRFKARSTQWQYFIINKSGVPLEAPVISRSGNSITFTGPENVTTKAGQPALFFSSGETLLQLSEYPGYTFSLTNNPGTLNGHKGISSAGKTIVKTLPRPDPVQYDIINVKGEKQFSSPMYVFI